MECDIAGEVDDKEVLKATAAQCPTAQPDPDLAALLTQQQILFSGYHPVVCNPCSLAIGSHRSNVCALQCAQGMSLSEIVSEAVITQVQGIS